MPIITATEYKTQMGISGTAYDTIIGGQISMQQAWLERQCGQLFDEDTYTDDPHDGDGSPRLWLKNTPVTALTAVKLLNSDGSTTTLDSSSYRLVDGEYLTRVDGSEAAWEPRSPFDGYVGPCFPKGDGNVLVSYTAGYADEDAPDDLKALMYTLVAMGLDERGQNPVVQQRADGVVQRTRMSPMDARQAKADLIRPWKRVMV